MRVRDNLSTLRDIIASSDTAREYISMCVESDIILSHGEKSGTMKGFREVNNISNRLPTNTPEFIHDYIDTLFEYRVGHPYRSSALFTYAYPVASIPSGRHIAIPVGESSSMMYVEGLSDFYYTIVKSYYMVAHDTIQYLSKMFSISDEAREKLSESIFHYLEQDMIGEGDYAALVIPIMNIASAELRSYINSENFEKLLISFIFNYCDDIVGGAKIIDDISVVDKEEVHLHSERYILIGSDWLHDLCAKNRVTVHEFLSGLL